MFCKEKSRANTISSRAPRDDNESGDLAMNFEDENPILNMMMRMMEQQNRLIEGIARSSGALRSDENGNMQNGDEHCCPCFN